MDERTVALRPIQLAALGLLTYGALRRSWVAALAGVGLLAYDFRRGTPQPEFAPLDLVSTRLDRTST